MGKKAKKVLVNGIPAKVLNTWADTARVLFANGATEVVPLADIEPWVETPKPWNHGVDAAEIHYATHGTI